MPVHQLIFRCKTIGQNPDLLIDSFPVSLFGLTFYSHEIVNDKYTQQGDGIDWRFHVTLKKN